MRSLIISILTATLLLTAFGCSQGADVVNPANVESIHYGDNSHQLWGIWQFTADPVAGTLDVVQLREAGMHLNALPFLEPPPLVNLTLESLIFNGNIIEADIGLRHPFLGLNEFTGFDVAGILITNGSVSGFDDPDLVMAGADDTHLLNPDGFSRWWNPAEFPHGYTMMTYNDGLLGTADAVGDYNSTLNAYKSFCDDLTDPDMPIDDIDITSRCVFSAGQKNIRHYSIELGDAGLVFNYAIDANWQFPQGSYPWEVPDDFLPAANRTEAWNVSITEDENTLWNDGSENGGDLSLLIDVWDHYDAALNAVKVESPGNFGVVTSSSAIDGGEGYSTYAIDIIEATPAEGSIDLLITVESEAIGYQDLLPGKNVSAYFMYTVPVAKEPYEPPECGTGNHGPLTTISLTDVAQVARLDSAWLVNGPYAGEMLIPDYNGSVNTLRRYNMDNIGSHSGNLFATLPAVACPPPPPPIPAPFIFHIEAEPVTGRVIVVPFGPEANNVLLIFDNQGNLLGHQTGLSVGAGRKIMAIGTNDNGDLWLVSSIRFGSWGDDCQLQRWVYQSSSPYYSHDTSSDLVLDEIIGFYNDKYGYLVENDIVDLVVTYPEQRIFLWQAATYMQHNGRLHLFDIEASGPPTHRPDLSSDNLLSLPTYNSLTDYSTIESAAIICDHADPDLDGCRVSVFSLCRTELPMTRPLLLARIDRDGNVLNETNFGTGHSPYTMGINHDSDPSKANLVFLDYQPTACAMAPPPADW